MEYKSESTGAKIIINPCSFVEAFKLKSVLQKAMMSSGKSIEELFEEDLATLIFSVDGSEEVMYCLFDCLKKSLYNDKAIKPDLFDDVTAREDLYEIFFNCIKVNLHPFLKTILSKLGINVPLSKVREALTQKLETNSGLSAAVLQDKASSEETQTK